MLRNRSCRIVGLFALFATLPLASASASAVGVGDVAVIYFAADNPDAIAFVALREVPGGTTLRFTDSGWQAGGSFRASEGGVQYVVPSTLAPGAVVSQSNPFAGSGWSVNNEGVGNNGFLLSTSGDQVLTFVGAAGDLDFIHAVHFNSTGYADAVSSNTTGLPPGLSVGASAINLDEADNGYYNGPTTGSPTELLAAIGDPSNWFVSDSRLNPPAWSFNVTGVGAPTIQSVSVAGVDFDIDDGASITVALAAPPTTGSPATVELSSGAFASPQSLVISHPQQSGSISIPVVNAGVWTVSASAVSGVSGTATSASFTVGDPVVPPIADAGPDIAVELAGAAATVWLTDARGEEFSGAPGATYAWTPATGAGVAGWQNRTGALTDASAPGDAAVTFDAVGSYVLTLTVTDGDGLTDVDAVLVTVNNPAPVDEYGPPAGYYDGAVGLGAALKNQLAAIITSGHVQQSYGEFRYNAARYDADPDAPGNILLAYTRASVSGNWDGGGTWNREHVWPQSRQPGSASNGSTGNIGDPFALRPINPGINSYRGNLSFGQFDSAGSYGVDGGYFFPGDVDKGDVARSLMYSATRYSSTLTLADGDPGGNAMGDLAALVRYHYVDAPDTFERRRAHLIYLDQNNRNPYIDLPEVVWSIWGDGANDSKLYVSATEPADGSSTVLISFPPVIVGGPAPAATPVTLRKVGVDPTYFLVETFGDASASPRGRYNAFDFNVQQRSITCGLAAATATSGLKTGSVRIDNLDISSEGAGRGADDGDDLIELELPVLAHAEASFAATSNLHALELDFGRVRQGSAAPTLNYQIHHVGAGDPSFIADLDLLSVAPAGNASVLFTDAAAFANLPPGGAAAFSASCDPSAAVGAYEATYQFKTADADLPGATLGATLTLTLRAEIYGPLFPFDDDGDHDVDALDWLNFVGCIGGPLGDAAGGCANHDANTDGAVDLIDVAALQQAATGSLP